MAIFRRICEGSKNPQQEMCQFRLPWHLRGNGCCPLFSQPNQRHIPPLPPSISFLFFPIFINKESPSWLWIRIFPPHSLGHFLESFFYCLLLNNSFSFFKYILCALLKHQKMPKFSPLLPIALMPFLLGPMVHPLPFGLFSSFSSFDPRPISLTAFKGKMGTAAKLPPKASTPATPSEPIVEVDIEEEASDQPESPPFTSICTILLRSGLYERHAVTDEEKWQFCGRHCARRPECFFTALPCQCPCSCKQIEEMTSGAF